MQRQKITRIILGTLAVMASVYFQGLQGQGKVTVNSEKKAKIGTSYQIDIAGDRYVSKDSSIAYVNEDGMVTAKKLGETEIRIVKDGEVYKQHVTVTANGKKTRAVKVSTGEIVVMENNFLVNGQVINGKTVKKKKLTDVIEAPPVPSDMLKTVPVTSSAPVEQAGKMTSAAPETVQPSASGTEQPGSQETAAAETKNPQTTAVAAETKGSKATAAAETKDPQATAAAVVTKSPKATAAVVTKKPVETPAAKEPVVMKIGITLKNQGEYKAKKVVLYGGFHGKNYKFNFGALAAGETKTVQKRIKGYKGSGAGAKLTLKKLKVYSNKMITSYKYATGKTSFLYGTEDTKAPVISGFIGKDSYNQGMPYRVVYGDEGKDYDYFQYVKAEDDRDGKVDFTVNTSRVNFKKAGIYQITYIAEDKAGNKSKAKAKLEVRLKKDVDRYASEILSGIIKEDWSVFQKATAIYNYTRHHISYVGYSNKGNWENGAIEGIRYGRGDCFTYYAVARALLTRAGIPNILVKRYRGAGHHWWNMVYVNGGWYHYDCGPRPGGGRFCMLTDEQLTAYSRTHGNKYIWNYDAVPKSGTKRLTSVF